VLNELGINASADVGSASDLEPFAAVKLSREPVPGRTISVSCPNKKNHRNGDRNPSLVLWVNENGLTGGSKCMVCNNSKPNSTASKSARSGGGLENAHEVDADDADSSSIDTATKLASLGNESMTYRVVYQGKTALLFAPQKDRGIARTRKASAAVSAPAPSPRSSLPEPTDPHSVPDAMARTRYLPEKLRPAGGFVMSPEDAPRVGHVPSMSYVQAKLQVRFLSPRTV